MRPKENYTRYVGASILLTVSILVLFQIYILREPDRITADEAAQRKTNLFEGHSTFLTYCSLCHGEDGEGIDAPPLNDKSFFNNTAEGTIFSIISSGVPGTEMPAWNQSYGGPLTDQQIQQVVTYIQDWEANAPDRQTMESAGDPVQGLVIFNSTCFICHGEHGMGTDRAPALNDPVKLAEFDDEWYVDTITEGRPAQGMPTWGTVLSPEQVRNVIALLRSWQSGEIVQPSGPEEGIAEALHMLGHGDIHAAEHAVEDVIPGATGEVLSTLNGALEALEVGDTTTAEEALSQAQDLLGMTNPTDQHTDEHDAGQ